MKECKLLECNVSCGLKQISKQEIPGYGNYGIPSIEWGHYPDVEEELTKYLNDGWTIAHADLQGDCQKFLLIREKD